MRVLVWGVKELQSRHREVTMVIYAVAMPMPKKHEHKHKEGLLNE